MICWHCFDDSVHYENEFTFEEYGLQGEGTVTTYHCETCGANFASMVETTTEKELIADGEDGTTS